MTIEQFKEKFPGQTESNQNELLEDMACPKCGQRAEFRITSMMTGLFDNEGQEEIEDHGWEDDSKCECFDCGHVATIKDFTIEGLDDALEEAKDD